MVLSFDTSCEDPSLAEDNTSVPDDDDASSADLEGAPSPTPKARTSRNTFTTWYIYAGIFLLATLVGVTTYFYIANAEDTQFRSDFESFARETAEIAESRAHNLFGQMSSLAISIAATSTDSEKSIFPNVTIPHLDLRTQRITELTGADMILFVPFVEQKDRLGFEQYSVDNQDWLVEDFAYHGADAAEMEPIPEHIHPYPLPSDYNESRRGFVDSGFMEEILATQGFQSENFSVPIAQFGPRPTNSSLVMTDLFSHPIFKKEMIASLEYDVPVISEIEDLSFLMGHIDTGSSSSEIATTSAGHSNRLCSFTLDQVKRDFFEDSETIGFMVGVVQWETFFGNVLPPSASGIVVTVVSDCGSTFTYGIRGGIDDWTALGDHHDSQYDDLVQQFRFFWKDHPKGISRHCHFDLHIYPSDEFKDVYISNKPLFYSTLAMSVFLLGAVAFFFYSTYMKKDKEKVMKQFVRAETVVKSLFPDHVGDKLMQEASAELGNKKGKSASASSSVRNQLLGFADGDESALTNTASKPIADQYTETTVLFADIVGFTSWSSKREPSEVFTLLETLYGSFDQAAAKYRIFKVETIGDCYVAVSGLPNRNKKHHINMARFADACLTRMQDLCHELAFKLGPGTSDLGLRVGMHSGEVTAGVLRGERARFQLFGDTVNTAARMESSSEKNCIHISQETADRLIASDKSHWVIKRENKINAKGKGQLQTYWLDRAAIAKISDAVSYCTSISGNDTSFTSLSYSEDIHLKLNRLVTVNVEMLSGLLENIADQREKDHIRPDSPDMLRNMERERLEKGQKMRAMDEFVEIISLPSRKYTPDGGEHFAELDNKVYGQLQSYCEVIARLYRQNPFHNFEHATQVATSMVNLLAQVQGNKNGIAMDPLTQFAMVFASLIHDVDHSGVPNATLVQEKSALAAWYRNKSVAEQNSIDVAWRVLMDDDFVDLRRAIYCNKEELEQFRQVVINSVLATDIMDKELKNFRNGRWEKAFGNGHRTTGTASCKATVIVEHMMQVSDVAHTMQEFKVYREWNRHLFREMYRAYKEGRTATNPATNWYEGELGFFDFYIIPLAQKINDCGVFGMNGAKYLQQAKQNRKEWQEQGPTAVAKMQKWVCGRRRRPPCNGVNQTV